MWASNVRNEMKEISNFWYNTYTATPQMARLQGGFLIKRILNDFMDKSKPMSQSNQTFVMYSAHDYTVYMVLGTLRLYDVSFFFSNKFHFISNKTLYSIHS